MSRTTPTQATCGRCGQTRPCFPPRPGWGAPDKLCSPCWSRYADARAARTYLDFSDAFDNASDDELEAWMGGSE